VLALATATAVSQMAAPFCCALLFDACWAAGKRGPANTAARVAAAGLPLAVLGLIFIFWGGCHHR